MEKTLTNLARVAFICLLIISLQAAALAQGKGRGSGGGPPAGRGGGPPSGVGVDRGVGTSSTSSMGRADAGRGNASEHSNGRSDAGLERARMQQENSRRADKELREHPHMANNLHTTANDLRSGYQAALATNPNLTFGQYVSATRVATNLGRRNPNITRSALLTGLASGQSLGQTLHNFGLSKQEAKDAEKRAEHEIKDAKRP